MLATILCALTFSCATPAPYAGGYGYANDIKQERLTHGFKGLWPNGCYGTWSRCGDTIQHHQDYPSSNG